MQIIKKNELKQGEYYVISIAYKNILNF